MMEKLVMLFCALVVTAAARTKNRTDVFAMPEPLSSVVHELEEAINSVLTENQGERITIEFAIGDFADAARYSIELVDIRLNEIKLQLRSKVRTAQDELAGADVRNECARIAAPLFVKSVQISDEYSTCVSNIYNKARRLIDGYVGKLDKVVRITNDLAARGSRCVAKFQNNVNDFRALWEAANCLDEVLTRTTKISQAAVVGMSRTEDQILTRITILRRAMATRCTTIDEIPSLIIEVKEASDKIDACTRSVIMSI